MILPIGSSPPRPQAGITRRTLDDTNGDGLPDTWQIQYFGSISSPQASPGADPDGDGFSNLQEYLAGTDPTDAHSYLRLDSIQIDQTQAVIRFTAMAGRTYSLFEQRAEMSLGKERRAKPAGTTRHPAAKEASAFRPSLAAAGKPGMRPVVRLRI